MQLVGLKKNAPCRLIQHSNVSSKVIMHLQYVHMLEYLYSLSVLLGVCLKETMDAQMQDALSPPQVKAIFQLGSETYSVEVCKGILSEQLISMKEQSMTILKDYITKHNVPNEVPDEPEEFSSEDDGEIPEQPPVKSKKRN